MNRKINKATWLLTLVVAANANAVTYNTPYYDEATKTYYTYTPYVDIDRVGAASSPSTQELRSGTYDYVKGGAGANVSAGYYFQVFGSENTTTINKDYIVGGDSSPSTATITGNVGLVFFATDKISIGGNIYLGGASSSTSIVGDAQVSLIGSGSNLKFTGTLLAANKGSTSGISGNRYLQFGQPETYPNYITWNGAFNGTAENFNYINVGTDSNVTALKVKLGEHTEISGTTNSKLRLSATANNLSLTQQVVRFTGKSEVAAHFYNSTFSSNTVSGLDLGGLICAWNLGGTKISDSTFTNNSASSNKLQGGVVYANSSDLTVENSYFDNNEAVSTGNRVRGSVLYINNQNGTISDSVFSNNTGTGASGSLGGGTIYIENQSTASKTLTINNSVFENNSAISTSGTAMGGAIFALYRSNSGADINITDSTFTNNFATTSGGAIHLGGEHMVYTATKDIVNVGNKSNAGGFLYLGVG